MGEQWWIEMYRDGRRLGGGLRLTSDFVVTAAHCLGRAPRCGDLVQLRLSPKQYEGTVVELPGADLALIKVTLPDDFVAKRPPLDRATSGDPWIATYRPTMTLGYLTGKVTVPSVLMPSPDGELLEVIQLSCRDILGSHHGYSGSPVEREPHGEFRHAVLGILWQQQPNRRNPEVSSGMLFAVSVGEAIGRFGLMSDRHLLEFVLTGQEDNPAAGNGDRPAASPRAAVSDRDRIADKLLKAWGRADLLDAQQIHRIRTWMDQNPSGGSGVGSD